MSQRRRSRKRKSRSRSKARLKSRSVYSTRNKKVSGWTIYTHPTKDDCPSCIGAKEYLSKKHIKFKAIRGRNDGYPNRSYKTWPKIYSQDREFIGGFSELKNNI